MFRDAVYLNVRTIEEDEYPLIAKALGGAENCEDVYKRQQDFDKLVMIVSRASGAPVIAGAMEFATNLINHDWKKIVKDEWKKAEKAGLKSILDEIKKANTKKSDGDDEEVAMPPKEICTEQIPGIEVMDLEDAVKVLWKNGIYAESGMGCTGPIVRMAADKKEKAVEPVSYTHLDVYKRQPYGRKY